MGGFTLGKMTFGSLFKKPETILYPTESKPVPEGLKGHIIVNPEVCNLCGLCAMKCPCNAISVDKTTRTWSCDGFTCVQCGSCIPYCAKKALSMDPAYTKPSRTKSSLVIIVPELEKPEKKEKETSEEKIAALDPEKAAKVKAALEAKKKREAEEKIANLDPEKAAKVKAALEAKAKAKAKPEAK